MHVGLLGSKAVKQRVQLFIYQMKICRKKYKTLKVIVFYCVKHLWSEVVFILGYAD